MDTGISPPAAAPQSELPTRPEDLLARLRAADLAYTLYHHAPVFTVAEGEDMQKAIPGTHCRNLFLRDRREQMALVMLANDTKVDLKKLPPLIGLDRISFGSAERLWRHLGVRPGSVCPFSLINDADNAVKAVVDHTLMSADLVNYHPLDNSMTVGMRPRDLIRFLESIQHLPHIVDLTEAAPAGETE